MHHNWKSVKREHILKAIQKFDLEKPAFPKAKFTFLLYRGKQYPAKHIRGMAYQIANKKEIPKTEYTGGKETAEFLEKLNFKVIYPTDRPLNSKKTVTKKSPKKSSPASIKSTLIPADQKNALQILLQKKVGIIETEKRYDWLKTPDIKNLPIEYKKIIHKLKAYRGCKFNTTPNLPLQCDFVVEDKKLIFEYDEQQHFTEARRISLENYPPNVKLYFHKATWVKKCDEVKAKDSTPIDRDEIRAFYDSVRDIEAAKNGYKLYRINHGDYDWSSPGAEYHLNELLKNGRYFKQDNSKIKIARLIITNKQYDRNYNPIEEELKKLIKQFLDSEYKKRKYEFLQTPGGFLKFKFPKSIDNEQDPKYVEKTAIKPLLKEANKTVETFLSKLEPSIIKKLRETVDYFTIGIDGGSEENEQHIELVAVYDLKKNKVIRWTGKSYPVEYQKDTLIKINDLNSHLIRLNKQKVVILGCHDLNIYSPRGQASLSKNSLKQNISAKFKRKIKTFNPDIILQHPHTTDTPNIWNPAWKAIEKELPNVQHFASGIKYDNRGMKKRGKLNDVLEKTKKGSVHDFLE